MKLAIIILIVIPIVTNCCLMSGIKAQFSYLQLLFIDIAEVIDEVMLNDAISHASKVNISTICIFITLHHIYIS